jgi:hypothetical protein
LILSQLSANNPTTPLVLGFCLIAPHSFAIRQSRGISQSPRLLPDHSSSRNQKRF